MLQMFKGIAFHQMFIPVDHDWELMYSREESCRKKLISGTFMVCFILSSSKDYDIFMMQIQDAMGRSWQWSYFLSLVVLGMITVATVLNI